MYAGVPFFFPILFHPCRFTLKVRQDLIGRNAMDTHAKPLEKALLVEDNDIMQKIHSLYLKELGFEVDLADTGYKALELAANKTTTAFFSTSACRTSRANPCSLPSDTASGQPASTCRSSSTPPTPARPC